MKLRLNLFFILINIAFLLTIYVNHMSYESRCAGSTTATLSIHKEEAKRELTVNVKNNVYAIVFYGRKRQVSILYKYLLPNLKVNGGVLEKIIFCVKTNKTEDLAYLDEIMKEGNPYLERVFAKRNTYDEFYHTLGDEDIVFKIDDDILFIQNGTFERMLEEFVKKNATLLSANVINHTILSHVHARLRAILPFYEKNNRDNTHSWVHDTQSLEMSPLTSGIEYDLYSKWWTSGQLAAVAHESFLHHIYNNNLDVYNFGRYDFNAIDYQRWSINFILFKGKFANKMGFMGDEVAISKILPKRLNRHGYALGSSIVAHFSYHKQIKYLEMTDILDKYEKLSKNYFTTL